LGGGPPRIDTSRSPVPSLHSPIYPPRSLVCHNLYLLYLLVFAICWLNVLLCLVFSDDRSGSRGS
jgi:hypothetical protein